MLTIAHSRPFALCDGVPRRAVLRAGALAVGGLTCGLTEVLRLRAESPGPGRRRQKSVIMIYLHGGPSQLDMYDMKPEAPVEYRGEFSPIRTNVPGMEICELMPLQAKIADKFAILRGVQMGAFHSGNEFYSGSPWQEFPRASVPGVPRRPAFGSIVARVRKGQSAPVPYVSAVNSRDWEQSDYVGPDYEPFRVAGANSAEALENLGRHRSFEGSRFEQRRHLLQTLDDRRRVLHHEASAEGVSAFRARALEIIASGKVREAFDVDKEPKSVRERYGEGSLQYGLHPGRPLLQSRRLVEAGVSVVTTCLYHFDTHAKNFITLRELLPPLDRALHALITDLEERGLLEDVAVVMGGEFGRNPRIGDIAPDGRGHWSESGFMWMAGGGLKTGQVIGATDRLGARSIGNPIKMQNVLATLYHVLGIDPSLTLLDHRGRPQYLLENRQPIAALI